MSLTESSLADRFRTAMAGPPRGARVLGMHLEGPYLNPAYLRSVPSKLAA